MGRLMSIEEIGESLEKKLSDAGIKSTEALLRQGATLQGRKSIAERTGLSEKLILEWVNHADLFRIRGVGGQYADLLEEGGVDSVVELAQRKPEHLHQKLLVVNQEKKLVRRLPSLFEVRQWVDQANRLPRMIFH